MLSVILRFTDSDYPFGIFKLLLPSVFSWVRVAQSLVFYVVFCPFYFAIVLSVRFKSTDFDSPFGILKLFLRKRYNT